MAEEEETREVLFSDWSGPEKQGMTLEQSGEGEIYVKEVKMESPAGRTGRVHEGDQIVGATIYFDNMSSEETAELLKTLNKHKVGLKLQNKDKSPCRSPMGTLSPSRSPMGTLTYEGKGRFGGSSQDNILSGDDEDYKRIYSKKIKPRLKSEDLAEGVDVRTERHSSTSTDGSTITTITRRITTYTVDMPGGVDEQLELTGPEQSGGDSSSSQIRVLHGSGSPSGIGGGLVAGELGGDGVSFTGPHVTSSSEKHWSTGGVKTTAVTREMEVGDGGAAGIRFKGPSFGMSGAKGQGEFGLCRRGEQGDGSFLVSGGSGDYQAGSASVTVPGRTTNISSSAISMGEGEVRGVDVNLPGRGSADWVGGLVPEITVSDQQMRGSASLSGGNQGGVSLPNKPGIDTGLNGGKISTDIRAPKLDINTPGIKESGSVKMSVKGQSIKETTIESESKLKGGIKIPSFGLNTGGAESDGDVKLPQVKGTVDVSVPGVDVDVSGPSMNVKGGKKMGGVDIKAPKVQGSGVDIEGPEGGFKIPKVKMPSFGIKGAGREGPAVDVNLPKADIDHKAPKVDIKGPSISGPKISMPDVDINLKGPKVKGDVNVSLPKLEGDIKAPKVDIEGPDIDVEGLEGGFKMPKIKMPSFGIKGPKVEGDVDVKLPKGEIDIKGPNVNIKGLALDIEDPDGKIKVPKFKMPSMSGPKISTPEMDISLKGPKLKGDVDMSVPKIKGDISAPKVDIGGPDVDIEGSGGFKMPKMKMPSFGFKGPKLEGPDVDVNLPKADIDIKAPKVDIKGPELDIEGPDGKIKGPKFKMPSMSGPNISMPDVDFNLKGPKMKGDFDVSGPKIEGDVKAPKVDIEGPDVDIEGSGGFKMPKMKMPSFGIKGPKLEGPEMDVNLPKADIDIEGPEIDIKGPDGKIKDPKFKMPSISGPKISMPDVDINLKTSKVKGEVDVSVPKLEGDIKTPKVDIKGPDVDI
ncbi:unnamed protein product [Coregonus sp. 'balchen']|nr:unnamed protein product [Coregonus sp. 'balchen']